MKVLTFAIKNNSLLVVVSFSTDLRSVCHFDIDLLSFVFKLSEKVEVIVVDFYES